MHREPTSEANKQQRFLARKETTFRRENYDSFTSKNKECL